MPRPTLPESFAALATYDIKSTRTTEDDLWEHFCKLKKKVAEVATRYLDIIAEANKYFQIGANNPYYRHNWRHGSPNRERKGVLSDYVLGKEMSGEDCKFQSNHTMIISAVRDFTYCSEVFKWYETRSAEECEEMYEIFSTYSFKLKQAEENYEENEDLCFYQAKKRWETKDKEWIMERDLKKSHEAHRLRFEWEEAFRGDAGMREFYNDIIPDTESSCKYCIERKKIVEASREIQRMQEEQQKQDRLRFQQEEESRASSSEEEKGDDKEEFIPNVPILTCETCKYSTQSKIAFKFHNDSKEHKRKEKYWALHCKDCNFHARCESEMDAHMHSRKHKIQTGQMPAVEEQTFFCEACEYHAATKAMLDIHNRSQKHKRNTGVLAPKIKQDFHCEACDYITNTKWLYEQHCSTDKHHKRVAAYNQEQTTVVSVPEIKQEC